MIRTVSYSSAASITCSPSAGTNAGFMRSARTLSIGPSFSPLSGKTSDSAAACNPAVPSWTRTTHPDWRPPTRRRRRSWPSGRATTTAASAFPTVWTPAAHGRNTRRIPSSSIPSAIRRFSGTNPTSAGSWCSTATDLITSSRPRICSIGRTRSIPSPIRSNAPTCSSFPSMAMLTARNGCWCAATGNTRSASSTAPSSRPRPISSPATSARTSTRRNPGARSTASRGGESRSPGCAAAAIPTCPSTSK